MRSRSLLLAALGFFICSSAFADCMQNFNVKPDKQASYAGWLPGSDQLAVKSVNCRALELSRQQLFVEHGTSIDPKVLASVQAYATETSDAMAKLVKARADLQEQLSKDAGVNALRVTYRVLKYEFGKASALIGCLAPDLTVSKAMCAIGLAILAEDTGSVLDGSIAKTEISERSKKLDADIKNLQAQYEALMKMRDNFRMDVAKQRYTEMFEAMCSAVQKQCL
jgi:hypothetical protein